MKRLAVAVAFALLLNGCSGCRKPKPLPPAPEATPVPWHTLCIEASPQLNWYDQKAHTLYLRVFPLASLEGFLQADVDRLLDPRAALTGLEGTPIERTLYPGSKITLEVPLKPSVDFVGIVAGYYRLDGIGKAHRKAQQLPTKTAPCIRFGPNAIEVPAPAASRSPE